MERRAASAARARIIAWAYAASGRAKVPQTEGFDLVKADAYHWLFIYDLYVEMSLYG
jgi:hypothetical protein